MKCACCETTKTTELRQNPLYPYLVDFVPLCDSCFYLHKIPYNAITTLIALYDDVNEIPKNIQNQMEFSLHNKSYMQFIKDIQAKEKILNVF